MSIGFDHTKEPIIKFYASVGDLNTVNIIPGGSTTEVLSLFTHGKLDPGIYCGFHIPMTDVENLTPNQFNLSGVISPEDTNVNGYNISGLIYDISYKSWIASGASMSFDGFTIFASDIKYLETPISRSDGIPYHFAIVPITEKETSLDDKYIAFKPEFVAVYSTKQRFNIYIPRLGETAYWGIYLSTEKSITSSRYETFINVRKIYPNTIFTDKDERENAIESSFDPNNKNNVTYWYSHPTIIRIGVIKQEFTGIYSYSIIYADRDENLSPYLKLYETFMNFYDTFKKTFYADNASDYPTSNHPKVRIEI